MAKDKNNNGGANLGFEADLWRAVNIFKEIGYGE
jgi:hypothetical protein